MRLNSGLLIVGAGTRCSHMIGSQGNAVGCLGSLFATFEFAEGGTLASRARSCTRWHVLFPLVVVVALCLVVHASVDQFVVLPRKHTVGSNCGPRRHIRVSMAKAHHTRLLLLCSGKRCLGGILLNTIIGCNACFRQLLPTRLVIAGAASSPQSK